jgi:tetraacyldisaccharide 4'-kinase
VIGQRLTRNWYRETASPSLLQPLSWLYGAVVALRRRAFNTGFSHTQQAGKPVIVVGNLTVGGTGKTPLVAWLAQQLSARGLRVGLLSRGYGRSDTRLQRVHADSDWRQVGDEPLLLRQLTGCETIVARDRVAGARALVADGVDLLISDDGLQHLALARDCEIIVVDGARGFGNGRLLPAGPLREPVSRLTANSIMVINGPAEHASLRQPAALVPQRLQMNLSGDQACRLDGLEGPKPLRNFRGQRVHAVAGIGHPARFFRQLQAQGLEVIAHPFPDHHPFSSGDLTFADGLPVLMTGKDAVKCRALGGPQLWYVPVVACFVEAQQPALLDLVADRLAISRTAAVRIPGG